MAGEAMVGPQEACDVQAEYYRRLANANGLDEIRRWAFEQAAAIHSHDGATAEGLIKEAAVILAWVEGSEND